MLCCLSFHQLHGLQQPTDEAVAHDLCDSFLCFDLIKHITCVLCASTPHLIYCIWWRTMQSTLQGMVANFVYAPSRDTLLVYTKFFTFLCLFTHICAVFVAIWNASNQIWNKVTFDLSKPKKNLNALPNLRLLLVLMIIPVIQ